MNSARWPKTSRPPFRRDLEPPRNLIKDDTSRLTPKIRVCAKVTSQLRAARSLAIVKDRPGRTYVKVPIGIAGGHLRG